MDYATAQPLSYKFNWVRSGMLFVLVPVYALLLTDATDSSASPSLSTIAGLLLLPVGGWAGWVRFPNKVAIAYTIDLLLFNQQHGVEQIPLMYVYQIKYVLLKTYYRHHWKIGYYDYDAQGQKQLVQLLPVSSLTMDEFTRTVRRQNPQVEIRHWYFFSSE